MLLLTTARNGRANVMAMSWQTMLEFEPPLIGCVVSANNYSFAALRKTKECVIAIPTVELAKNVVRCGNISGRDVNKFEATGLTPLPATEVQAPLIAECYVNLECRVTDTALASKYNFFILEVVAAWRNKSIRKPRTIHHAGNGVFIVDGETIRLKSRMK